MEVPFQKIHHSGNQDIASRTAILGFSIMTCTSTGLGLPRLRPEGGWPHICRVFRLMPLRTEVMLFARGRRRFGMIFIVPGPLKAAMPVVGSTVFRVWFFGGWLPCADRSFRCVCLIRRVKSDTSLLAMATLASCSTHTLTHSHAQLVSKQQLFLHGRCASALNHT